MNLSAKAQKPGTSTRFKKGHSGNPKGRPKAQPESMASAYDIIVNRTITLTQNGVAREATLEEGLILKTYHAAVGGNRSAIREILKMIEAWNKALLAKHDSSPRVTQRIHFDDPENAYEALQLLDIAIKDPQWLDHANETRLMLQPWAMQLALKRLGKTKLSSNTITLLRNRTRDPGTLAVLEGKNHD